MADGNWSRGFGHKVGFSEGGEAAVPFLSESQMPAIDCRLTRGITRHQ